MQFNTPVSKPKLYEIVADKIEAEILKDPTQIGKKLPSEQELTVGFQVSRTVIREAIKLLEARSLVTVRNGEGVFVEKPRNEALTDVLRRIVLMDEIEKDKIYEMRLILEPFACKMAAQHCANHPEKLEKLENLYKDTVDFQFEPEKRLQNDLEFHIEIARLSENPILHCFVSAVRQMIAGMMKTAITTYEGNELGVRYHECILAALKAGDEELAFNAMESHLKGCSKFFGQQK